MLCLVGLQNVNPQKWGFKKVKVQLEGYKKISHMLVPIIRLKLTRDAAFAYYFVPGFKTKLPIFLPRCQNLKFYQGTLSGSLYDQTWVQKINLLLVKSN